MSRVPEFTLLARALVVALIALALRVRLARHRAALAAAERAVARHLAGVRDTLDLVDQARAHLAAEVVR